MLVLKGKYNTAKVYTTVIEDGSKEQIISLLNNENYKDAKIRIMPDCHSGAGCVIGLSMTITDKVSPNLVGVDIGCGVITLKIKEKTIDFNKLDKVIRTHIPSGFSIRNDVHKNANNVEFDKMVSPFNLDRAKRSIGSLGSGNHFIEVARDYDNSLYLLIHSGSRNFGHQIAEYYQNLAIKNLQDIESRKELAYLHSQDMQNYLNDMKIAQNFAYWNRITIANIILEAMSLEMVEYFDTVHNYIDLKNNILRKGAVSAQKGEKLIIPINMRDGSIIALGRGNEDWNYTAPHGAGRLFSRIKAKEKFSLQEFAKSMEGIFTTSISNHTLDECPMSYKDMSDIVNHIFDTVDIVKIIKPVYNFKA